MLFMESLGGIGSINHSESEETLKTSEKRGSAITYKIITLVFSGLTGLSAFGLLGLSIWTLYDLEYYALLDQMEVIGYICIGFAIINIITSVVFKKNMYVFILFSFLTAIFGSFQFIVFAVSPFGVADKVNNGLLGHFQYIITFVMSLITLLLTYLYIIISRKEELREKEYV